MPFIYIPVILIFAAFAWCAKAEPRTPEALIVEDQEVLVQVAQDGSYTLTDKTTVSAANENAHDQLALQRLPPELLEPGVELLEAGVINDSVVTVLDLEAQRSPASLGDSPVEILFPDLGKDAKTWTKVRRTTAAGLGGVFSMDLVFGFLRKEKRSVISIVSELPLYFQINDPQKLLQVEGESGSREIKIRLTEPVFAVTAETLRVASTEKLRRETPRIQISSVGDWTSYTQKIAATVPLSEAVAALDKQGAKLRAIESIPKRASRALQWMGETFSHSKTLNPGPPESLSDIFSAKEGDARALALVAQAIFKAAEIESELLLVGSFSPQNSRRFLRLPINDSQPLPSGNYFNRWALRYRDGERWVVVDPSRGLGSAEHAPYYFKHSLAVALGSNPQPFKIELPEEGYAETLIHTELVRRRDGEFEGRGEVEFRGEMANFMRDVYFSEGEGALRNYVEAFASVAKHRGFMYRKLDFFDRSSKSLKLEMSFSTFEPKGGQRRALAMPPHYLPFYSRPEAGLRFVGFPMRIEEVTTVRSAFVAQEEKYDCEVYGPLVSLSRRVENAAGNVSVRDELLIPTGDPPGESEDDQARLSTHSTRLSDCAKNSAIVVETLNKKQRPFSERMSNLGDRAPLVVRLRKAEVELGDDEGSAEFWRQRGRLLRQLGYISEELYVLEHLKMAEAAFKKAVTLAPTDVVNLGEWGVTALYRGDLVKAREAWNRVSMINSASFVSLFLGGQISQRTGRQELAVGYFAAAVIKARGSGELVRALAAQAEALCTGLGRCAETVSLHEKILALRPRHVTRLRLAAQDFERAGLHDKAVRLERKATAIQAKVDGGGSEVRVPSSTAKSK